jgi:flagellar M-ring protein FliF
MKENVTRALDRYRKTFLDFTTGQKVVAILGTVALLLAGFMIFRWASSPSYAPLFSNLAPEDASAVVEALETSGTPYELAGDGSTVMVPREMVYSTRIDLSGEGLPTESSAGGYSILDEQGMSTSEFQESTAFKRAMEGELTSTIEALDDVDGAVVHLAMPEKQVFSDEQEPTTASVLVETKPGTTLSSENVQAIVHLVASSIDGMDPKNVTIADSAGKVLTTPEGSDSALSTARAEQTNAVQDQMQTRLQAMLDKIAGPGNSTVQVTAVLDFDKTVTNSVDYNEEEGPIALSQSQAEETYTGTNPDGTANGVVGVDGQMDDGTGTAAGDGTYQKSQDVEDRVIDTVEEQRETAPGAIEQMNVGVVLDSGTTADIDPAMIRDQVAGITGITNQNGTIEVSSLPFDKSAQEAAQQELDAADAAEAAAARADLIRKGGIAGGVLLLLLLAWVRARRRAKAREQATSYVVEQLKAEQARLAALETAPAALALEQAEENEEEALQDELDALIERQPEDVAQLLRGWLVENK